ncbi:putative porin [Robertkochia aurantiaca]|uniref:putative porin n=1 Tax=Robertkochia aurantiaca TaxID=2873700 RepID=UPI001CCECCD3|nr:putative porin [Robertkochia sp. 3YJGBD-33]
MRVSLSALLVLLSVSWSFAQVEEEPQQRIVQDTLIGTRGRFTQKSKEPDTLKITDYKIISHQRDTTHFDTTLTVEKEYRHNYLRKDNFELLPFSNAGQTYNQLGVPVYRNTLYPAMGMQAKHYFYMEVEDIDYYRVPTPTTELMWKTVMEQGHLLDALITINTSPKFNFSLAYKGMRSLGKYQHILVSSGNFRFTANYGNTDDRYRFKAHIASQDLLNQENGGIAIREQFTSGSPEFTDRARVDVKFQNAENFLIGKRYYFDQQFDLVKPDVETGKGGMAIGHILNYETKTYEFRQDNSIAFFGDAFQADAIRDRAKLRAFTNELYLRLDNRILGDLQFFSRTYDYNYFFNSRVITEDQIIENQIENLEVALGGRWKHSFGPLSVDALISQNIQGDLGGSIYEGGVGLSFSEDLSLNGRIHSSQRKPDFNYLLYQSDYQYYNWQNTDRFTTEKINTLSGELKSEKWGALQASYTLFDDRAYFANDTIVSPVEEGGVTELQLIKPYQYGETIGYLKVKFENDLHFGRFGLRNTLMYQEVSQDDPILNVPQLVTRNTLYYSNHLFDKAMYIQTGVTFKYFTAYKANAYSPLLGEFYIQDTEEIGDFPVLDFFINAKVQRTRIFFKLEHVNSSFTGYNFYSAPDYPYRDFIVRFGLVWNFFS